MKEFEKYIVFIQIQLIKSSHNKIGSNKNPKTKKAKTKKAKNESGQNEYPFIISLALSLESLLLFRHTLQIWMGKKGMGPPSFSLYPYSVEIAHTRDIQTIECLTYHQCSKCFNAIFNKVKSFLLFTNLCSDVNNNKTTKLCFKNVFES